MAKADARPEPLLSETDRHSALWLKLKKHFEERIALLRARNDNDLDEAKSARLRGRIAETKYFLGLGDPGPEPVEADE